MSWDKFGSPYDPNHSGKNKLPPEKRGQPRAEFQLGGCGDPNCSQCNPHTANIPRSTTRTFDIRNVTLTSPRVSDWERMMREELARGGFDSLRFEGAGSFRASPPPPPKPASPPPSYVEARDAVKKWIVPAPAQAFDDIVGNKEALEQLRDAIRAPVEHKALYEAYGMTMPKGAMLSGPPGCGKTMFARAAASEMKALYGEATEFISISGAELQSPYIGVTEGYIKAIFVFAREYKAYRGHPLLVFMDEAEVLLPDRTGRVRRVAPWEESQVATFLAEMDGIQESGAFVLLATNRPNVIDQAVLRDGRCDFKIVVKRPTMDAAEQILRNKFAGIRVADGGTEESLVFAAVEALFDPHKIIAEAHMVMAQFKDREISVKDHEERHFLLEHIMSGAMAASVPARAKRYAFTRDKVEGIAKGVTVDDVLRAVNDLFEENKSLDHRFAMDAFMSEFMAEAAEKSGGGKRMSSHVNARPSANVMLTHLGRET